MVRKIEVVPYQAGWPGLFEEEAGNLAAIFGQEIVAIHHIGSTAIPPMSAKPIIDILVEVRDLGKIDDFSETLLQLGYLPKGEFGVPGRRFFIKGDEINRTHHIHVYHSGHPEIEWHLNFRDYLVAHPEQAQAYGRLKEELAGRFPTDIESYMAGKKEFIKETGEKAKAWKESGVRLLIRQATEADVEIFRELRLEALRTHPEVFASDYEAGLAQPPSEWTATLQRHDGTKSVIYFAFAGSLPVGMTGLFRNPSPKTQHSGTIWGVYVRPNFRGQRVGQLLVEACLRWAGDHSLKVVKLGVISPNTPAIRCYTACGFRVYGIEPKVIFYNNTYYDELLMVKEIDQGS